MGAGTDEERAIEGLRAVIELYSNKAQDLDTKTQRLAGELEEAQAESARTSSFLDELTGTLRELQRMSPRQGQASNDRQDDVGPTGHRTASSGGRSRKGGRAKRPRSASRSKSPNRELWREVLQVLATSGRPMHVKEIAAALGRPTKDKAGLSAVETIRATCKRQVKYERAVEGPVGVFAIAREPGNLREVA